MTDHDQTTPGSHPANGAPEEPKTPMWLPALGATLFLIVGIWWATRPAEPSGATTPPGATAVDAGPG